MKPSSMFFTLLCSMGLCARQPVAIPIGLSAGLPSATVFDMLQDEKGYWWFGTEKGLYRFDGLNFKNYPSAQGGNSGVSNLMLNGRNIILCQDFSGAFYFVSDDSLKLIESISPSGNYHSAHINSANNLVVKSKRGVAVYDDNFKLVNDVPLSSNLFAFFDFENQLNYIDSNGWHRTFPPISVGFDEFLQYKCSKRIFPVSRSNELFIFPRQPGKTIAVKLSPEQQVYELLPTETIIQNVTLTDDSVWWIATTQGLYLFDRNFKPVNFVQPLFEGKNISFVYADRQKNVWVGTLGYGLFRIPSTSCSEMNLGIHEGRVLAAVAGEKLLVGTERGVIIALDFQQQHIRIKNQNKIAHPVYCLFYDTITNTTIAGVDELHVWKNMEKVSVKNIAVKHITPVNTHQFIVSSSGNITKLTIEKSGGVTYEELSETIERCSAGLNLSALRIYCTAQSPVSKAISLATGNGVFTTDFSSVSPVLFQNKKIVANSLAFKNDTLVVASRNHGLFYFHRNKLVAHFNSVNTSMNDEVKKVIVSNHDVWAICEKNVFVIKPFSPPQIAYSHSNVLHHRTIKDAVIINSNLFLLTGSHIMKLPLESPFIGREHIDIFVEKISSNGNFVQMQRSMKFNHRQNNIAIHFSAPFAGDNSELKIYYNINGSGWQQQESGSRLLNLTSLNPGSYNISLMAKLPSGIMSDEKKVSFKISPPFWKTWWFYFLSLFSVTFIFILLFRYRVKLMQKQNQLLSEKLKLEEELHQSMLASLKAQMNPHFIFNALNSIQEVFLLGDNRLASKHLSGFSRLIRNILKASGSKTISLEQELEMLGEYLSLEALRFGDSFKFEIIVDDDIDTYSLEVPPMIIQPFAENSVKHGLMHKEGEKYLGIRFSLDQENQLLVAVVTDNGIGRKASAKINEHRTNHESFATSATEKRFKILNQNSAKKFAFHYDDLEDEAGNPLGTSVVITIPIQ